MHANIADGKCGVRIAARGGHVYGIPGSHPAHGGAELMLERKGIDYRRFDVPGGALPADAARARVPGPTVPAVSSTTAGGSRARASVSRALDGLCPSRRCSRPTRGARGGGGRPSSWGDKVLQEVPRRIA